MRFFLYTDYTDNTEKAFYVRVLLLSLLRNDKNCFYVDIGCNHPYHDNNSFIFYKKGWKGINIDPQKHIMDTFSKKRGRDINITAAVSLKKDTVVCWMLAQNTLTTLDENVAKRAIEKGIKLVEKVDVPSFPLRDILQKHLPKTQRISFLFIDAEGLDLQVLQSNDWEKYRPKCVLVEINDLLPKDIASDPIVTFMETVGFIPYGNTINN